MTQIKNIVKQTETIKKLSQLCAKSGVFVILLFTGLFFTRQSLAQGSQVFTSNGTFNLPAGVTSITVEAWGGGAGGNYNSYGGGGGGAYATITISNPNNSYSVTVGTGGGAGNNGNPSIFGSALTANGAINGAGGTASTGAGITSYNGGNGGGNGGNSGGGAGASASGPGANAVGSTGGLGISPGGSGGNGSATGPGNPGFTYGGGGGSHGTSGGSAAGAAGAVIVSWTCPAATISYTPSSFCNSVISAPVTINGTTGGAFSTIPTTGLSINGSGEINPSASTGGGYTVHYKIAAITGCTAVDAPADVTINPTPISTVTAQTNITCYNANDGTITVQASGGTSPYTFSINNGTYASGSSADANTFSNLAPNTSYQIKVKDNNGCISK